MLSDGMKEIKKCALGAALICLVLLVLLVIVIQMNNKKQYLQSDIYLKRILSVSKEEITLDKVFDFDFDKAYVADEVYGDEDYFIKTLGVSSTVEIPTLETGAHSRILFIKADTIVYDFVYEMQAIQFSQTGMWIFPDTRITVEQQSGIDKENSTVRIVFRAGEAEDEFLP